MSRYFKRRWDDPRGDEHDAWGASDWYFEVDDERYPLRQIEMYQSGDAAAVGIVSLNGAI